MKKIVLVLLVILMFGLVSCAKKTEEKLKIVEVKQGSITAKIQTTGLIMPRNRIEIKSTVAGRVETINVKEGQSVYRGESLALISSTDRAALIDAARSKGKEEQEYWEEVYRPAPIIAPLNGFIIQRAVEPGQSVTTSDPILVMADRLIVQAQVDETDLGKVKLGQNVEIILDAYLDKTIIGKVQHIAYESKTVNNVNIYEVDVIPKEIPDYFRAGMSATVNFILSEKKNILVVPVQAVKKIGKQSYVFVNKENNKKAEPKQIKTGLEGTDQIEVMDGLKEGDEIVIPNREMTEQLNSKFSRRRGPINPFQKNK